MAGQNLLTVGQRPTVEPLGALKALLIGTLGYPGLGKVEGGTAWDDLVLLWPN